MFVHEEEMAKSHFRVLSLEAPEHLHPKEETKADDPG